MKASALTWREWATRGRILGRTGVPVWAQGLFAVGFLNWFVFFGVSLALGGTPLQAETVVDGRYYLETKGGMTQVSEALWLFMLFYATLSLVLMPAGATCGLAGLAVARRRSAKVSETDGKVARRAKRMAILAGAFTLLWSGAILSGFVRALRSYLAA